MLRLLPSFFFTNTSRLALSLALSLPLFACAQPILSLTETTATRLPNDRIQIKATVKNIGNTRWIGSSEFGSDRFCVQAHWFENDPSLPYTQGEACFDLPLLPQASTQINFLSTLPLPTTNTFKIQIRLQSVLPNPEATLKQEITNP